MNQARTEIFARLRAIAATKSTHAERAKLVLARLNILQRGPVPSFSEPPLQRFIAKLEKASASVELIDDMTALPAVVEKYMAQWGLVRNMLVASHPLLTVPAWPRDMIITNRAA